MVSRLLAYRTSTVAGVMQIIGDIAGFCPGFLDAGGSAGNEFGARFRFYGQCGNDIDHEILPVFCYGSERRDEAYSVFQRSGYRFASRNRVKTGI
jgi:hypothetical protein